MSVRESVQRLAEAKALNLKLIAEISESIGVDLPPAPAMPNTPMEANQLESLRARQLRADIAVTHALTAILKILGKLAAK